jgi:hypothetical protein
MLQLIASSMRPVESRQPADPSDPFGNVQLSGLVHGLIEQGFFVSQMAAIRRLSDTYPLDGTKGVISLTGLLNDIIAHHHLLTRRSIFDAEHIEYDHTAIEQRFLKFHKEKCEAGEIAYFVPRDCSSFDHDRRHKHMDFLAGVEPSKRQPSDQIRRTLLENLKEKISGPCQKVNDYVNKFIAHAATPES